MKITCEKENLTKALLITEKITGTNPTLPILGCVLLIAKDDVLVLRSTNIELGIEVSIPIKSKEDGIVAVPGHIFYNTIQNTHDSIINIETKKDNIIINTKHSETILNTQSHDDFPSLPIIKNNTVYKLKSENMIKGIDSVIYSASNSTIKPELSSIYVYGHDGKIFFVATDSFRLAEKTIQTKDKNILDKSFLLPLRNAIEILRIFNQIQYSDVSIKVDKNQISFECGDVFITSRIIDGVFPDYKQIIPKDYVTEVIVLKQDLLNLFKKINIFSNRFGQISVDVQPQKNIFIVHTNNDTVGKTSDSVDSVIKGEALSMSFNYRYIYDCLNSIQSDSVTLLFTGIGKPLIIKGVSDLSFLYLVMPMNK
ncbi:MAG TPA: DNA polymerase III subunit beta [Candidatus Kaiserbacteria bacterium]|nr:DNA polymerase III subunit beta [Candidatus Kaiserbacteria bacterium]